MKFDLKISCCLFVGIADLITASPIKQQPEKRQLNGLLGSLTGLLGINATYDYVIVGGGTGGLTIAARLAEIPNATVAVVEAGGLYQIDDPFLSSTPSGDTFWVGSSSFDTNPLIDWDFVTAPQAGAGGREIHYARGKCLGGSSARNFMIYQRGSTQSYQRWADAVGDQSYTFENLLPFFMKSVAFTPPNSNTRFANASAEYAPSAFSSSGGPLHVSYPAWAAPFSTWMEPALREIGLQQAQDFNSGSLMGSQYCSSTIDPTTATRDSAQTSFLDAAAGSTNLKVYDLTLGKKIIFDSTKKATGVVVESNGLEYNLGANKEVIVSAGAFQSPQLLMVSGVGPMSELQKFNIPVVADLPGVGQNMIDHVFFGPTYRVNVPTLTQLINDPLYLTAQLPAYFTQQGPLTNPVSEYLGWEKIPTALRQKFSPAAQNDLSQFPADWPEIEFLSGPGYIGNFSSLPTTQPTDGYQYATILSALVAPLSRGTVSLSSASTSDLPIIDPNWLTSPTDQEVAIAAYKRVRAAFASTEMAPLIIGDEYFPGSAVQSDDQILDVIQETVQTVWHASCTCKMGNSSDNMAVVDSNAKVFGVSGLRVVDASSFALLPPGHPQSTVYVLAEKIADAIQRGL